ncbi:sugar transferase [Candidatus Marithrix sp. Canyon 246]|uniref:sugar transferase n=1 Tax=Candidatus Marithrix sp. Canyon 246 TaxID=1827136 RepID=UPI00084A241C|nr:exopolysaccharide biosynthesis polyprenyl glycosylphosphotransferase [Candidatus Marithrix sp. Canyon 246]
MLKQIHQDKLREILLNRYDHIGVTSLIYKLRFYTKRLTWNLVIRSAYLLKRLLDIIASGIIILLLSPLFLTIAALIYIESPGAVLFKQTRVGRWGTLFTMWKFRSMYMDAEERKKQLMKDNEMSGGVLFKMKHDPRITKIGRFIRKVSIDELPQLWNVFKGDMSLVGPRPPVPAEVDQYSLADRRRLEVIPGITCVWQVSGRSDIPFPQQVELDVKYIESQSLWTDIKILFQTIPAVLMGKGAY